MLAFLAVVTLLALVECKFKKECPPKEMLSSCNCIEFSEFNVLNCVNVVNVWDLIQDLHTLKDYSIYQVNLWQVNLQYIPAGFLKYLPIKSLVIRESTILALESEDGKVMFQGADESLEEIFILAVRGISSWRWKPLQALINLKQLLISTCEIKGILADFNLFSKSLQKISLNNNEISFIDDNAFSNYNNLKNLDLSRNEISGIKRSMFSNPENRLEILNLSVNKIELLPDDLFTNMPHLKEVYIRGNKIRWLSAKPFAPIIHHLNRLSLDDNDIHCCPDIEWIISANVKKNVRVDGTCGYPPTLYGKNISSLDTSDLDHGMC